MTEKRDKQAEQDEQEKKKREIFEGMSSRRQQKILKKGYDKWDPFLAPKDPPFFRLEDKESLLEATDLFRQFLHYQEEEKDPGEPLPAAYVEGAREICFGLIREKGERFQGIYDFCRWFTLMSGTVSEQK